MKSLDKNRRKNKKKVIDGPVPTHRLNAAKKIMIIIFALLTIRIGWIQFVQGAELKEAASRQQTLNKIISPKRGRIYDTNGKALAISAEVDTITINPKKFIVEDNDPSEAKKKTLDRQQTVAKGLSEIFELDYETVLAQVQSKKATETIVKKVEKELVDKLEEWMKENKIKEGINIDEDNKRYYPYDNLASHLLGFTGTDSQGLFGIEHKWNSVLQGTHGKIVTATNVDGSQISDNSEQYIEAQNGSDIYLTIDVNIQKIVEDYLKEGVEKNGATAGSAILMDPKTGNILAMSTYPDYNLNDPFTINIEEDKEKWDTYSKEDRTAKLNNMWADRNYSRTYEPGSTFKLIVSAVALEEEITGTDIANDFHCEGSTKIGDERPIACAGNEVHGNQSLRTALRNSCNAAFIQLGERIGATKLYKYFDAFGLFERTGVEVTGESASRFHELEKVGPIERAVTSFGQRFEITPLQLITAVSAIANDGTLIKPRVVKKVINTDTGLEEVVEETEVRRVVSEETAKKLRDMMKTAVEKRENVYGTVAGYSVGGKTGTSEPSITKPEEGYAVSYLAIAPADDPEVVGLVVIYNPATENPYGSRISAPILSKILTDVLPYMGIASEKSDTSSVTSVAPKTTKVPDVTNKTLTEAKKTLENLRYKVVYEETENSNSVLVKEQVPAKESNVQEGATIVLYTEENSVRTSVAVPNLIRNDS